MHACACPDSLIPTSCIHVWCICIYCVCAVKVCVSGSVHVYTYVMQCVQVSVEVPNEDCASGLVWPG